MNKKRLGAEALGTFFVVFAPLAWSASASGGLSAAAWVSGIVVMAMIAAFGPISAAHFNPAVTLGFAVARRFPWRMVPGYIGAQFGGAILAAGIGALLFGAGYGVHVPTNPGLIIRNTGVEILITAILMLMIMATATDRRVDGAVPPLCIGFAVVLGVFIGGPITGGSMNPARSLGPALFAPSALPSLWLYLLAPPIGAMLAATIYERLRLDGEHAKGAPEGV